MLSRGINLHSLDDEAVAQVSSTQHWCTLCGDHMRRQPKVISTDWTDREELWRSGMESPPLCTNYEGSLCCFILCVCFSVLSLYTVVVDIDIGLVNIHS